MRVGLFDFQIDALDALHERLEKVRAYAAVENPRNLFFRANGSREDNSHDRFI